MVQFLARQKYFENQDDCPGQIPCGLKILSKLLYLARFLRYKQFCILKFLQKKFEKFKMAPIFGETKFF